MELVDQTLPEFDEAVVRKVIGIGLLCIQASPASRPSMSRVVGMLTGDVEIPPPTSKPSYITEWNFTDLTAFTSEIYSSTSNADNSQVTLPR